MTLLLFSLKGSNALDVLLKLKPRKYKYNAYITISLRMSSHVQT
jgi:hypothetical protein